MEGPTVGDLNAKFDRLWEATRPVEPDLAAWDALWDGVTARLDKRETVEMPTRLPFEAIRRRRGLLAVALLAQAAAVLGAVTLWSARRQGQSAPEVAATALALVAPVDLPSLEIPDGGGQVGVIRQGGGADPSVELVALTEHPNAVDSGFAMFNYMESMATE